MRSARTDVRSYVCYAPQARSRGPRSACCARDSLAHEEAGLTLPKGFSGPNPKNQPPVFVAQDRQDQHKNELRPTVHSLARLVKGEIVALWSF